MNKLGVFCLAFSFLFVNTCGQNEEGPERLPQEIPEPTRRTHLHRVTGGAPRVRVMSNGNNEENDGNPGNEDKFELAVRTSSLPVDEGTTSKTNEKSGRVTENPVEITTKHCPGCPITIHHNDTNIQKYARNATEIYKARKEIPRDAVLERVYDVKRQVVNGIRYQFKVVYSYSLAESNIKNMATCEVEVLLHHTRPDPHIEAKPCKKPRLGVEPEEAAEEEMARYAMPFPKPRRD